MSQKFDTRQSISHDVLANILGADSTQLKTLLQNLNKEINAPYRISATSPTADSKINFQASEIEAADLAGKNASPVNSQISSFAASTIDFQSGVTTGGTFSITFPNSTVGYFRRVGFSLDAAGTIQCLFSPEVSSFGSLANAGTVFISGTLPIGWVDLEATAASPGRFKTAGSATNIIENKVSASARVHRIIGGGGSGTGGNGILSPSPGYGILVSDTFDSLQSSVDDTLNQTITKATYSAAKKLYQISLDKSKVVLTNAGSALTIAAGCSFTVAVGDIVYVTSGVRINQWRKISAVISQTSFTLDSAFSGGPADPADTLMFSQAVHTSDLAAFGSASELNRPGDFYSSTNILQILISYTDSLAVNDDIGDFNSTARVVVSAANEGTQFAAGTPTSDLFTQSIFTRPTGAGQLNDYILTSWTNKQRLFLTFFANPNNASVTTTCNLLDYDCNFYADAEVINGGVLNSAYGTSDNSTTAYNCTVATSGGLTYVDLAFSFNDGADPGGVGSQLRVVVNGQAVPKFVSSGVTPTTQLSYTLGADGNGLKRRVTFNADLSVSTVDIMIVRQFGMYDASFSQTNKLTGLYDAIVGSSAQVTAGTATHSSLQAAHDAVAAGSNILVLNNVTLSADATVTLSKKVSIVGKGNGSVITGILVVGSGAAKSSIDLIKFTGNITFQAGADFCFGRIWQATGQTFSNDASNTSNVITVITE